MPLPRYELGPEGGEVRHTGPMYNNIVALLKDLRAGVRELGVGKCEVLCLDKPQMVPAHFGFELSCYDDKGNCCWWHFLIPVGKFGLTSRVLPEAVVEAFLKTSGRAKIAKLIGAGVGALGLEKALLETR